MFETVNPGKQFSNCQIQLWRDMLVKIDLHQKCDQFGGLVHIDSSISSPLDNCLGQLPPSFGHDFGCRLTGLIGQGYGKLA